MGNVPYTSRGGSIGTAMHHLVHEGSAPASGSAECITLTIEGRWIGHVGSEVKCGLVFVYYVTVTWSYLEPYWMRHDICFFI